tara:strand:- start:1841 stop:1993 length:153 start_codon:yes stop_codon:yes gene_type:complete
MSKQYENMSKEELIALVKRLSEQHNEWRALAIRHETSIKQLVEMSREMNK